MSKELERLAYVLAECTPRPVTSINKPTPHTRARLPRRIHPNHNRVVSRPMAACVRPPRTLDRNTCACARAVVPTRTCTAHATALVRADGVGSGTSLSRWAEGLNCTRAEANHDHWAYMRKQEGWSYGQKSNEIVDPPPPPAPRPSPSAIHTHTCLRPHPPSLRCCPAYAHSRISPSPFVSAK